jgi:FixJ family two-component response regulator
VEPCPTKPGSLIAVVDDEESVCRALERLLRSVGFDVETFASGAAFLESRGRWRADCVVLDVHMPGLSGSDVQARLSEAAQDVPVVVITGRDTDEARERAMAAGAAAYLRKPVDDQTLLATLATAMARGGKNRRPFRG